MGCKAVRWMLPSPRTYRMKWVFPWLWWLLLALPPRARLMIWKRLLPYAKPGICGFMWWVGRWLDGWVGCCVQWKTVLTLSFALVLERNFVCCLLVQDAAYGGAYSMLDECSHLFAGFCSGGLCAMLSIFCIFYLLLIAKVSKRWTRLM